MKNFFYIPRLLIPPCLLHATAVFGPMRHLANGPENQRLAQPSIHRYRTGESGKKAICGLIIGDTGEGAAGARCAGIRPDRLERPCPAGYESGIREPGRRLNKRKCCSRMDLRLRQNRDSQRDIENWWVKLPVKVEQLQLEVS